ncbi:hypothetical protein P5673_009058 [Acropora cervicornis]|uniref:Uncharacterized protein n=1 Tax=Acropora cervicornis TaxID=6130 RepID=A0AAD9VAX1_ACRCE|nr:hypothetical protein P5673_009058 [Acropora cervicornis]
MSMLSFAEVPVVPLSRNGDKDVMFLARRRVGKEETETPGRPRFEIPGEMLEELRELGFSWIKIGEILGVSRWTIHRSVEEYGLQNMTGFHYLPD